MNVMTAGVSERESPRPLAQLQSFSFCPKCLTRVFFNISDNQHTWEHCSKRWTAIPFVDCPVCKGNLEFFGQPACPYCRLQFPDGVPLSPYLEPDGVLDRVIKSRAAAREFERHRTNSEYRALYASWSQDSAGVQQVCVEGSTRFSEDLRSVLVPHFRLLDQFARDIDKFLYGAPIRLAKFEAEYSWKFDQELCREVDLVLDGMLNGRASVLSSLGFLARYRLWFPETYSRHYLEGELRRRFQEKRKAPRPEFQLTLDFARTLSGRDFEEWLARLLRDAGIAEVCVTQASRDQGADLVITIGTRKIVMQAKQCQDTIGNGAVQEVLGALPYYGAAEAWVVTTSTFSKDAIDLAFRTAVRLVPGNQLLDLPAMIRGKDSPAVPEPAVMETETEWVPKITKALVAEAVDHAVAAPAVITGHDRGKEILAKLLEMVNFKAWKRWQMVCIAAAIMLLLCLGGMQGIGRFMAESQIRELLQNYQSAEFRGDATRLAECYTPIVQTFYLRHNVSRTDVQATFDQAFRTYSEAHLIKLSDIAFRKLGSNEATAEFEKSWDLRGARNYTGAEREEMIFRKIDGSWHIVSERELKIHWIKRNKN